MNDDGHRRCQYVLRWDKDSFFMLHSDKLFYPPALIAIELCTMRGWKYNFFIYLHYLDIHIRIFTIVINVHDVDDEPLKNLRINFNQNQLSAFVCRKGKYLRKITAVKNICAFFLFLIARNACVAWNEFHMRKKLETICWKCIIIPVKFSDVKNQWKAIGIFDFKPFSLVYLTYSVKIVLVFPFSNRTENWIEFWSTSNVSKLWYSSNLQAKRALFWIFYICLIDGLCSCVVILFLSSF